MKGKFIAFTPYLKMLSQDPEDDLQFRLQWDNRDPFSLIVTFVDLNARCEHTHRVSMEDFEMAMNNPKTTAGTGLFAFHFELDFTFFIRGNFANEFDEFVVAPLNTVRMLDFLDDVDKCRALLGDDLYDQFETDLDRGLSHLLTKKEI